MGVLLASCSGFKKDYIVTDASYQPAPKWVKKGTYGESSKNEYKYFVSKASDINQRLCERGAQARATNVVANELATKINNAYNSAIDSNQEEAKEISSETLKQSISLYLAGIQNHETFWEKRKYTKELGAEKDETRFQCYALVRMDRKVYNRMINASIEKMLESIQDFDKKDEISHDMKKQLLD